MVLEGRVIANLFAATCTYKSDKASESAPVMDS